MMSNISDLCTQILKQLNSLGRLKSGAMLPGLSKEKILGLTSNFPFRLPESVVELYMWSEGQSPTYWDDSELFPGFGMESLPKMIAVFKELGHASEFPRFHSG